MFSLHPIQEIAKLFFHYPQLWLLKKYIKQTPLTKTIPKLIQKPKQERRENKDFLPLQDVILSNFSMTFLSTRLSSTARTWTSWDSDEEALKSSTSSTHSGLIRLEKTPFLAISYKTQIKFWSINLKNNSNLEFKMKEEKEFLLILFFLQKLSRRAHIYMNQILMGCKCKRVSVSRNDTGLYPSMCI